MKGRKGFTLIEIMLVVAIIGLLGAIAIPSLLKARQEAQRKTILNNLRIIDDGRGQVMTKSNFLPNAELRYESVDIFMVEAEIDGGISSMNWPGDFSEYLIGASGTDTFGTGNLAASNTWVRADVLVVRVNLGAGEEAISFQR